MNLKWPVPTAIIVSNHTFNQVFCPETQQTRLYVYTAKITCQVHDQKPKTGTIWSHIHPTAETIYYTAQNSYENNPLL